MHPALREVGAKNYFWDGKSEDIADDWKNRLRQRERTLRKMGCSRGVEQV